MASKRPFINEINRRLEFAKADVSCDYDFALLMNRNLLSSNRWKTDCLAKTEYQP